MADREPKLFRPSRMIYPGSRFGPKTRYDLPQRHKAPVRWSSERRAEAYGNGSELEAIIFNGTSLQPEAFTAGRGARSDDAAGRRESLAIL